MIGGFIFFFVIIIITIRALSRIFIIIIHVLSLFFFSGEVQSLISHTNKSN